MPLFHPGIDRSSCNDSIIDSIGLAAICAAISLAAPIARTTPQARQQPAGRAPSRPNIVWISNEDMGPRLGAYGDRLARTPMLDRLAKASVRYTHAFTTAPVCAPSRAAIITGMHQSAIGAQHMRTSENTVPELPGPYLAVPPFYVKAFPEYLRAAGYYTSNRVKTDYQFGNAVHDLGRPGQSAHWRNRPDRASRSSPSSISMVTHESRIFPSSPSRKGKPLVTDPAEIRCRRTTPTRRWSARSWRASTTTSPTWTRRSGDPRQLEDDGLAETPSCSTGAITVTACRAPSARSTIRACACRS